MSPAAANCITWSIVVGCAVEIPLKLGDASACCAAALNCTLSSFGAGVCERADCVDDWNPGREFTLLDVEIADVPIFIAVCPLCVLILYSLSAILPKIRCQFCIFS